MIRIEIPGKGSIQAEHLVLDYNGTLAIDGSIIDGVKEKLNNLAEKINIHVLTADTFGEAANYLKEVRCKLTVLNGDQQALQKQQFINQIGNNKVIAIGNGLNDMLMLKDAVLGIAVIQKEGASLKTLFNADIVCKNIFDALDLLINPLRIAASLRN